MEGDACVCQGRGGRRGGCELNVSKGKNLTLISLTCLVV